MPLPNQKTPKRLIIYVNDVKVIHDCSSSTAARKLDLVRTALAKQEHHLISIKEYCDYYGLDYLQTCEFLKLL